MDEFRIDPNGRVFRFRYQQDDIVWVEDEGSYFSFPVAEWLEWEMA
jgi:hypothetical protein